MDILNFCKSAEPAELTAMINAAASIMSKDCSCEEIELMAVLFDTLSDTLFATAVIERKQDKIRERESRRNDVV